MHTKLNSDRGELGFSLIELMIAMTLTLIIAGASATLPGQSFRMRSREDVRSDAIADAQRTLNIVSREMLTLALDSSTMALSPEIPITNRFAFAPI